MSEQWTESTTSGQVRTYTNTHPILRERGCLKKQGCSGDWGTSENSKIHHSNDPLPADALCQYLRQKMLVKPSEPFHRNLSKSCLWMHGEEEGEGERTGNGKVLTPS